MRNGQKRMRGRNNNTPPQEPESADAGLRVERARREDPRHRLAHRGKIHPARARLAELGRSGGGRELLSARRALFPPDRRRAGAVPPAEPLLQCSSRKQGQSGAQGAADDNYDDDGDDGQPFMGQNEPSYAPQPPAPQAQPYLPRDAQPFPPRDQQQHRPQHQPQQQPYAQPRSRAAMSLSRTRMRCRPSSPAAAAQPQAAPNANQGSGRTATSRATAQDRFGHRRRRRHRGGGYRPDRPDNFGNANPQGAAPQPMPGDGGDEPPRSRNNEAHSVIPA